MPYTPTTWANGSGGGTPLSAANLNHAEAGIAAAIPKDLVDAKGDLLTGTAADTVGRLAVGSNGQVLTADSTVGAGVKWASATGAMVQLYDNTAAGAIANWDVTTGLTGYNHLAISLVGRSDVAATTTALQIRFNNDTGSNYDYTQASFIPTPGGSAADAATSIVCGSLLGATAPASTPTVMNLHLPNYAATVFFKEVTGTVFSRYGATTSNLAIVFGGNWRSTAAITRVTVFPAAGNFILGSRLSIYGVL